MCSLRLCSCVEWSTARVASCRQVLDVVGSPAAVAACPEWATDYVLHSTTDEPARQEHVLGVDFGELHTVSDQFQNATSTVADLHGALAQVQDTASELILLRTCADVCKVAHLLRAAGPSISDVALQGYDELLQRSLTRCLGGQIDDLAMAQATLGVAEGGLGMRRAATTALPAFLASRTRGQVACALSCQCHPGRRCRPGRNVGDV